VSVTGKRFAASRVSRRAIVRGFAAGAAITASPNLLFSGPARSAESKLGIVSFPGPSISSHSKVIIKKGGLDTKQGWELDWQIRPTTEAYYNDFVSGAYDAIDFGGLNVFANLFNKGVPLQVVQATVRWPLPVVVRAEAKIKVIEDLKGSKLGVDRSSFAYAYMSTIARSHGFDLEKDVQVTNVGFFQAVPRLKRGDFEAAVLLFEHAIQLLQDAPNEFRLLCDANAEFAKSIGAKNAYQYQAIKAGWIKDNPGGVARVLATYRDLSAFFTNEPKKAVELLALPADKGGANLSEAVGGVAYVTGTKEGYKTIWTSEPVSGLGAQIQRELEAYRTVGLIEKLPGSGFLYLSG
jgi:ABC-type nitrate/sulfonate/bicarbonate transport system substrate-binding protein